MHLQKGKKKLPPDLLKPEYTFSFPISLKGTERTQ